MHVISMCYFNTVVICSLNCAGKMAGTVIGIMLQICARINKMLVQ